MGKKKPYRGNRYARRALNRCVSSRQSKSKQKQITYFDQAECFENTLYGGDCCNINQGDLINDRERNQIYLDGIKIDLTLWGLTNVPVFCNIAVINTLRNNAPIPASFTSRTFFRTLGSSVRNFAFSDVNLNGFDRYSLPMATDAMAVVHRSKFLLGIPVSTTGAFGGGAGGPRNWRTYKKYVPIKKSVAFNDAAGTSAYTQYYVLIWFTEWTQAQSGFPQVAKLVKLNGRITTYYKDKN